MRSWCVALLAALLLAAVPAGAQETRGAIEGVIRDSSGAVLPGVTVEARGAGGGVVTSVTDANGNYRFPALSPGRYTVTANLSGFNAAKSDVVNVLVGQLLKVDLTMAIAGLAETVEVTAEAPTIDVRQTTAATNIQSEMIDRVPKGRDFTSLVTLAPGANNESRSGGLSVDGASASENKYYIDGVDTTNLRTGVSATPFLTDFIDEVQVKSSGYAAEFGGATGGVISVISKSGTNQFRGELGTYFTGDQLVSKPRPTLRQTLTNVNVAEYITYPEDEYRRWEPFGQLGGPIVRDRLWFWAGYTPQLERTRRTVTFRSNNETGTFTSDERTHNIVGNLTGQLSQALRLKVSGQYRDYTQEGRLPAIAGTSNPRTNFADLGTEGPNITTTANLDWVLSNRLFLNGRFNYLRYDTRDVGVPTDPRYISSGSNAPFETRPNMVLLSGSTTILTNRARTRDIYDRIGASADATFFVNLLGQHSWKAGVQFERLGNDVLDREQAPNITLAWGQAHTNLNGTITQGQYGYYSWRQFGTVGDVSVNNLGLFLQDQWTVSDRLTINAGIRTERERVPSYRENLKGIEFEFGDKLAPRVGFAFDILGNGRWKAYGSWGMFYDVMKLELPRGAFGGDVWVETYYPLNTLEWNTIGVGGNFPGTPSESVDFRIPSNDPSCPECGAIDPDLKPFKQQELVFGLEHELTQRIALSARYVHKQVDRAIEDVGVLIPGVGEVFSIANPGEGVYGKFVLGEGFPPLPEVQRDYDALELKFVRRFADRWSFQTSYTYSRLYGNYPGLANSDEVARVAPNVTRLFDSPFMSFDQAGKPVYGRLNTDRPHQFKVNGYYQLPTLTSIGAAFVAASGIPITRQLNIGSTTPVFYLGRLSDGRTPTYTQLDLQLQQEIPLGGNLRGQLMVNVLNALDQDTVVDVFRSETQQTLPVTEEQFFQGINVQQQINALNIRRDPRFLQPDTYQAPRSVRVAFKLIF